MVAVAQLVERRSVEAEVAGSKPVSHPKCTGIYTDKALAIISFIKSSFIFLYFSVL